MEKLTNQINKRAWIVENLDKIIEESIYYRTFSFEMKNRERIPVYNTSNKDGKGTIK
jgi:hypothetical protein